MIDVLVYRKKITPFALAIYSSNSSSILATIQIPCSELVRKNTNTTHSVHSNNRPLKSRLLAVLSIFPRCQRKEGEH
jgi:hypothetical protein